MIRQHLDHPAVCDVSRLATGQHALEFTLERSQAFQPPFDLIEAVTGDLVGLCARFRGIVLQVEQRANGVQFEPKVAGVPDEREAADVCIRFSPAILPPYMRRSKSIGTLLPILNLKGLSAGDFSKALTCLLG